jgi:hypothetical protein
VACLVLLSLKNENVSLVEVVNRLMMHEFMDGLTNSYMTNMSYSRLNNSQFNAFANPRASIATTRSTVSQLVRSPGMIHTNTMVINPSKYTNRVSHPIRVNTSLF